MICLSGGYNIIDMQWVYKYCGLYPHYLRFSCRYFTLNFTILNLTYLVKVRVSILCIYVFYDNNIIMNNNNNNNKL